MALLRLLPVCLPLLPFLGAQEPLPVKPSPQGEVIDQKEESLVGLASPADLEAYEELADLVQVPTEIGARRLGSIDPSPTSVLRAIGMRFFPVARQDFQWDDNILLEDSSPHSARLSLTNLGLFARGGFWGGRGEVDLGYLLQAVAADTSAPDYDNFTEQYGAANVKVEGSAGYARAGFKQEMRTQPIEIQSVGSTFAQDDRDIQSLYAQVGVVPTARTLVDVSVDQRVTDHEKRQVSHLDGTQREFAARAGLRASADSLLYLKGAVGTWRFQSGTSSTGTGPPRVSLGDDDFAYATVGLEWTRVASLEVLAEVGARHDDFDDATLPGGGTEEGESSTELVGSVRARAALGADTRLSGAILRTIAPATGSNFQLVNRLDLSLDRFFGDRLRGKGGTFYEKSDPSEQEDSARFGLGLGLRYELSRTLDAGADWEWRERKADGTGGDYTDQRFTIGVALRF